jgi:formylmethanofuran dehydrogenase subunit C
MALQLTLRDIGRAAPLSIDLGGVVPHRTRDLDLRCIARLNVRADEAECVCGEIVALAGDPRDGRIECHGDFSRVHGLGAGMADGTIVVHGPVGRHAGAGMTGGDLFIAGDAGDWLAVEMAGGSVHVGGRAGDNAAAALPGSRHGMRGGLVVVAGDAGCLAGARMRRGILAVGGDCGEGAAFELWAGTVVVGGRVGPHPACGMRRGSLLALTDTPSLPPSFARGTAWHPGFLPLLLARLAHAGYQPAAAPLPGPWRQWHGDGLTGGRGEILHPEPG